MSDPQCTHKWVHIRKTQIKSQVYDRYNDADVFYCEKCLECKVKQFNLKERI